MGRAQKIEQPESATALDGMSYNLTCSLSSVTSEKLQWYRQFPGQGLQYIAGAFPGRHDESTRPRSTLYFQKDKTSNALVLHHVTQADAAVYFCVLSDTQWDRSVLSLYMNSSQSLSIEGAQACWRNGQVQANFVALGKLLFIYVPLLCTSNLGIMMFACSIRLFYAPDYVKDVHWTFHGWIHRAIECSDVWRGGPASGVDRGWQGVSCTRWCTRGGDGWHHYCPTFL